MGIFLFNFKTEWRRWELWDLLETRGGRCALSPPLSPLLQSKQGWQQCTSKDPPESSFYAPPADDIVGTLTKRLRLWSLFLVRVQEEGRWDFLPPSPLSSDFDAAPMRKSGCGAAAVRECNLFPSLAYGSMYGSVLCEPIYIRGSARRRSGQQQLNGGPIP